MVRGLLSVLEQGDEVVEGLVAIEVQLDDAGAVGESSDFHFLSDGFAESAFGVFDVWGGRGFFGLGFGFFFVGVEAIAERVSGEFFCASDAVFVFDDIFGEPGSPFGVCGEDCARVSGGDQSVDNVLSGDFGQLEESECVGDGDAGSSDAFCGVFVGHSEFFDEVSVGFGFFDGVEVFSLDVFDEGEGEGVAFGDVSDDDGDFLDAGDLCGAQASFSGDEYVSVVLCSDDEGLDEAAFSDGGGELVEGDGFEVLSRLPGHGVDALDGAEEVVLCGGGCGGVVSAVSGREQGVESSSESGACCGFRRRHGKLVVRRRRRRVQRATSSWR